ncbi:MAG: translation initiation factor IF-2 [Deltaproteobacteria bacterium]|nr:translation initiation factor IF-2 [Deltaproteobacteria bacterium]MBW2420345.1 translation initiation factor IF-2 [Deltaproteobacteria bacterium]
MAKIRAYKLAEEFGIEKNEFVEKAKALGFELKSAMAALTEEVAEDLRVKLGGGVAAKKAEMVEERVQRRGGGSVIRRRKRATPEPAPSEEAAEPELVAAPVDVATAESAAVAEEAPSLPEGPAVAAEEGGGAPDSAAEAVAAEGPEGAAAETAGEERGRVAARKDSAKAEAPQTPQQPDRKGKQRKRVREVVNLKEQEQFGRQITGRTGTTRRTTVVPTRAMANPRSRRRDAPAAKPAPVAAAEQSRVIRVPGEISVGELAKLLGAKAPIVQGKLMALGIMVSVNHRVDVETCRKVASEMGYEVQDTGFKEEELLEIPVAGEGADSGTLALRPPVVTVMGHVDHGKTSLLDAIRKTKVTEGEAGGITQHIGAYQVRIGDTRLTFIDTPGHAAFTHMRARGAQVTDVVVLVVAANDGVMPQTVEAIEHAQAAGCPILVAINKCDLPEADSKVTRQRLMEHNLVPEDFGGDVICVNVSAVTGEGIEQLLEMLSLQAEVLELNADAERRARGVVLEARLDKGRGPVATILVQDGTLRQGDVLVVGTESGRVRMMEDSDGRRIKEAGPSFPVQVVGLSGVPAAGASVHAVESEKAAKQIVQHREDQERGKPSKAAPKLTLEDFLARSEGDEAKELKVVLKADVGGTCEVVRESLQKLSTDEVTLTVLSAGVGAISENDVMLASASDAIVIGFHVRPDPAARRIADDQGIEIRSYQVIMDLLDNVKSAMAGLLPPTVEEHFMGRAEIRELFVIPRVGTIAGCSVSEGKIRRNAHCRLVRDGVQVYQGKVGSLKRFKEDAAEVGNGYECGIGLDSYNDVKIGDMIEAFELEERPATL